MGKESTFFVGFTTGVLGMCSETGRGENVVYVVFYVVYVVFYVVCEINLLRGDRKGNFVMIIKKMKIIWQRPNKKSGVKLVIWFSTKWVMKFG